MQEAASEQAEEKDTFTQASQDIGTRMSLMTEVAGTTLSYYKFHRVLTFDRNV